MTPTIAEIEARLQAATPGEWESVVDAHGNRRIVTSERRVLAFRTYPDLNDEANFDLFAHAPTDMRHLLSEYHAAQQRVSELEGELRHLVNLVEPALENGVRIPGLATCNGAKLVLNAMQKGAV